LSSNEEGRDQEQGVPDGALKHMASSKSSGQQRQGMLDLLQAVDERAHHAG
jgi:hypothetical protein